MSKKLEARYKQNYLKYCYYISNVGRTVLAKVLQWFYKGGDANYLDYLLSQYDISDIEGFINSNQRKALKRKTALELDLPLLHVFMQLSCSFYDEIEQNENCDEGYKILRHGVQRIVLAYINLGTCKPRFTDEEVKEKFNDIKQVSEMLISEGKRLSNASYDECRELSDEVYIRIMSLDNNLEDYYSADPSILSKEYWERLLKAKKEAEMVIASSGEPKRKDSDACHTEILEHKITVIGIKYKRTQRLKAAAEKGQETRGAQVLCDDVELEEKGRETSNSKEIQSKKGACKVVTANVNFGTSTSDEKSTSDEPVSENDATTDSLRTRIHAALTPVKSNHIQTSHGENLLPYVDEDVFLKQHQKYSRKPGQLVQLQDLLTVKGMNSDVAEIIIVSGGPGTGKTMLLEYISKKWNNDQAAIGQLCTRDVLLSSDLKKNSCNTFNKLILNSVKEEVDQDIEKDTLKNTVLEFSVLVTLDGYDESSEESSHLVKEVLEMHGTDLRVIITCRPQYVDSIYRQIPAFRRKCVSHLSLNGIPLARHAEFVSRLIDNQISGEAYSHNYQQDRIKEGLINRLPEIYDALGDDLCNPFLLKIITTMWIENSHIELQ